MANYYQTLKAGQQKVADLLSRQGSSFDMGIDKVRDMISAKRPVYQQDMADILSKYGPGAVRSGASTMPTFTANINRDLSEQVDRAKMQNKAKLQNRIFNTAFDNFVKSGMDVNEANQRARQLALDQSGYDFAAEEAGKNRSAKVARQNLSNALEGVMTEPINDPYEAQVVASLVSIGAYGGLLGYDAYKNRPTPSDPSTISTRSPHSSVIPRNSLRARSGYSY